MRLSALPQRVGKFMLTLAVCWQVLLVGMPLAMASEDHGSWESICSMDGAKTIWVDSDSDSENDQASPSADICRLCILSHSVLITDTFQVEAVSSDYLKVTIAFNDADLNRAWSDQARGPPRPL
jgi:hypothetical protein